jgi:ACT domain-containing protein
MEVFFIFLILFLLFFIPQDVISHISHLLLFIAMQEDSLLIFHHLIPVFGIRIVNIEWHLRKISKNIEQLFRMVGMIWINRVKFFYVFLCFILQRF